MKLTIIPEDKSVSKDSKVYSGIEISSCAIPSDIHALQWDGVAGWIEYTSPLIQNEPITVLPEWANCCVAKWEQADNPPTPEPVPPTAKQNKDTAMLLLAATDWTTSPDVTDPTKSNPYLSNQEEFIAYRNAIRQHAVYPVAGYLDWVLIPQENWVKL